MSGKLARMRIFLLAVLALYACSRPAPQRAESAAPAPLAAPAPADAWLGKWIGVEGNTLTIEAAGVKGAYAITEGALDGPMRYAGAAEGDHIAFVAGGKPGTIRAGSGDDTGLKYLAGKRNCLVIEAGRGFCRD